LRERLEEQKKVQKNNQDQKGWGNSSQSNLETRIILTGGKILELQEDMGRTLYFDQAGELTSKFDIKQVPALVVQNGKKLKISEIRI
jgi:conjugal transfer pilus assembly protein TraW